MIKILSIKIFFIFTLFTLSNACGPGSNKSQTFKPSDKNIPKLTPGSFALLEGSRTRIEIVASDYAEERDGGSMYLTSSDLDLTRDNIYEQTVGLYFEGVNVPSDAIIASAWVVFEVDEASSGPVSIEISGHKAANSYAFSSSARVTQREKTKARRSWKPSDWTVTGDKKTTVQIDAIIQEIIQVSGWELGNSLSLIFDRSQSDLSENKRVAKTNPVLIIEYGFAGTPPASPQISARGDNASRGEGKDQAFDNDTQTKWLDFSPTSWIQIKYPDDQYKTITSYKLTSANDVPSRDPKNWQLLGSNDGTTWTTLDRQVNITFSSRFQTKEFKVAEPEAFNIYRLQISENHGARIIQLSEISYREGEGAKQEYKPGIVSNSYSGQWTKLPNFDVMTPSSSEVVEGFGLNGKTGNYFGLMQSGYLLVEEQGQHTFRLRSDDGVKLSINGQLVIIDDGTHGPRDRDGSINLSPGYHSIKLEYFEYRGGEFLSLKMSTNNEGFREVPSDLLFHLADGDSEVPEDPETPTSCRESQGEWDDVVFGGQLSSGPMVGHTSDNSAQIWAYTGKNRADVKLVYQRLGEGDECGIIPNGKCL